MLYAPSAELIDYARRLDFNWVIVASSGHTGRHPAEEPPVGPRTAARRQVVRARMRQAKRAGLKVVYHTYEPSLPTGTRSAHPELYSKEIREYYRACKLVRQNRNLCVARPEVREALIAKVAEICRAFPDLDALAYTNNESSSTTKVWHRCDTCRDIPFDQTMKLLHDTMLAGIRRAGSRARLIARAWGTHDHDFHYYDIFAERLRFGADVAAQEWLPHYVKAFASKKLQFLPSRDIPAFLRRVRGEDTLMLYKASWADTNLHHPLNPWIGKYRGHEQICELSFEYCCDAPRHFYIMGREMQRRARLCAAKDVAGLCAVPINMGYHEGDPSRWALAELNMYLVAALAHNPEADLESVTAKYLQQRYGRKLPAELATLLLDTEDVAAGMRNIRGVRCSGTSFARLYHSLLRYGPMYRDWRTRLAPTPANVARIIREKDAVVAHAAGMVERIEALAGKLPRRAAAEFRLCFGNLLKMAKASAATHKTFMRLWALKEGPGKPTVTVLNAIMEDCATID